VADILRTDGPADFIFDRIFDWGLSAMSLSPTLTSTTLLRHRLNQLENGWHGSFASWMAALNGNDDIEGFLTSASTSTSGSTSSWSWLEYSTCGQGFTRQGVPCHASPAIEG